MEKGPLEAKLSLEKQDYVSPLQDEGAAVCAGVEFFISTSPCDLEACSYCQYALLPLFLMFM